MLLCVGIWIVEGVFSYGFMSPDTGVTSSRGTGTQPPPCRAACYKILSMGRVAVGGEGLPLYNSSAEFARPELCSYHMVRGYNTIEFSAPTSEVTTLLTLSTQGYQ